MLDLQMLDIVACVCLAIGMVLFVTRIFGANVDLAEKVGGTLGRILHVMNILQVVAFGTILLFAAFRLLDPGVAFLMIIGILTLDALGTAALLGLITLLGEKRTERLLGPLTEVELR